MSTPRPGRLVLVATPIGNRSDLSPRAVEALSEADVVACEDTRHSGRLLQHAGVRAGRLVSLHEHNEASRTGELVARLEAGETVAVVSDAGTPLVSDPGARLVAAAVAAGIEVQAVPGPSAALCALVVSGLEVSRFRFEGFLPRKGPERRARIEAIAGADAVSVCYEAPHRLAETLADLAEACGGGRAVVVARELTKLHEEVFRGDLAAASARASAVTARGEHVLVVDKAPSSPAVGDEAALSVLVARLLEAGLSAKDAASAARVVLGVSRRAAYEAALAEQDASAEAGPGRGRGRR